MLYSLLLLVLTSGDYILYIRWMQTMKPYKWYAGSFAFPLFGAIGFWIPVWIRRYVFHIEPHPFPQRKLFMLGTFDSINSILGTYATPYLSVLLMTILDKLGLPLTMIASCLYLGTRYTKSHYLGGFLVLYGVMISFIPDFDKGGQVQKSYWLLLYILSLVPAVASYCYKERHLKAAPLDIWWMNGWISVWQILFGLCTFPIVLAPLPSGDAVHGDDLGRYFRDATVCQFAETNRNPGDKCEGALGLFMGYQLVSTLANLLMFEIIREYSSVVYIVINTLKMPITAWLGSLPSLVGSQAAPIGPADLFSFVGIALGVAIYNREDEVQEKQETRERVSSGELVVQDKQRLPRGIRMPGRRYHSEDGIPRGLLEPLGDSSSVL